MASLNSIAGFSELIFDESLDTATRQEFRQLIQSNSVALASLMDNMLELSQLVSSEQPLPVEFTDIYRLCVEEMAKLKETLHNPNIECIITGDKDEATAPTNAFYLSRVIGNLLSPTADSGMWPDMPPAPFLPVIPMQGDWSKVRPETLQMR